MGSYIHYPFTILSLKNWFKRADPNISIPNITLKRLLSMKGTNLFLCSQLQKLMPQEQLQLQNRIPQLKAQPPITAAAIAYNSLKSPAFGSDAPEVITVKIPNKQAREVDIIKRLIFTLATGTPTALAATGSPPDAYIQFPYGVRVVMKATKKQE